MQGEELMRRVILVCLVAVLATGACIAGAAADTARIGDLIVTVDGTIKPSKLPRQGEAPIRLEVSGTIKTADDTHPPALRTLLLSFDRHGRLNTTGLPTCTVGKLRDTLTAQAEKVCGDALVGRGRVSADIALPEQAPFGANGPLLIFNGAPQGGKQVLIFHVHAFVPAPTTFVTTAVISRSAGTYGTKALVQIPSIVSGQGSLTAFTATLGKSWTYQGRKESLLLAGCPAGSLHARGEFTFADGSKLSGKVLEPCTPATYERKLQRTLLVSPAAGEVTRQSYREAVEPICKTNTEANERILGDVRGEVKTGKLKKAAAQFKAAAAELQATADQIKVVPRPSADQSRLSRWLTKVEFEATLFDAVATKLKAGDKAEAQRMVGKLTVNANAANVIVLPFEFEYCRLETSRFI
jgi:hypothetical protein